MKHFKDSFRVLMRSKVIAGSMILFYLFIIWSSLDPSATRMIASKPLGNAMTLSFYLLIALMFISYEYFKKLYNNGVAETIQITKKGSRRRNYWYAFALINIYAILIYISITIIVIYEFKLFRIVDPNNEYIRHIVKSTFLNNFLVMEVGIIAGIAFAKMKKRIRAYTIMTFFSLAVSTFPTDMAYLIDYSVFNHSKVDVNPGQIAYKIISWFYIIPRYDLKMLPHDQVGECLLPYRFFIIGLWMALFATIICLTRREYKKYSVISIIVSVVMIVGYAYPTTRMEQRMDPYVNDNGVDAKYNFYDATREKVKEEPANYNITEYKMDLSMFVNLSAYVDMKVSKSLDKYYMTLFHGYKISEVTDQNGNNLEFSQDRDKVIINNSKGYHVENIIMKYHGSSSEAYSNYQACYLPAYFAYYPRPGHIRINYEASNDIIPNFVDNNTFFKVKIKSPEKYISNLKLNNGYFEGRADGFTLVKGFYKNKELINGNTLIYPYLNSDQGFDGVMTEDEVWKETFDSSNEELELEGRKNSIIFIDPCLGSDKYEAYGEKQAFVNSGDASYYFADMNVEWK